MARYAQLTATGIPSGVPVTIKQNGKQVSNLFPAADATAPDNRARTGTRSGALSPATFVPNGTYSVEWSGGGALSVTVSGAAGLPPAIPFDMATQAELDASRAGLAGAYPSVATRSVEDSVRAVRDLAYRPWFAALGMGGSTSYWLGHSVLAGSGASSAEKACYPIIKRGILAADPTATINVNANPGYTSTQLLALFDASGRNATYTPLCAYMGLLNDYLYNVDPTLTQSNLTALVAKMKSIQPLNSPDPTFLILLEWLRSDATSPTYPWSRYIAAAQAVADADPSVTILDLGRRMGPVAGDQLGLYNGDGAHPLDKGHALIASIVLADILPRPFPPVNVAGQVLASKVWNPATKQVITTQAVTGAPADIDATNAAVTFVAPRSGNVTIRASAQAQVSGGAAYWCLKNGATVLANSRRLIAAPAGYDSRQYIATLTGLTPSTTYTLKFAHYVNNAANTATFVAGSTDDGPMVIQVVDAGVVVTTVLTP